MQIRVEPHFEKPLKDLADLNRRSLAGEGNAAIEEHLRKAKKMRKAGSKMADAAK